MNRFDESKIRRQADGKFASKPHSECDVELAEEMERPTLSPALADVIDEGDLRSDVVSRISTFSAEKESLSLRQAAGLCSGDRMRLGDEIVSFANENEDAVLQVLKLDGYRSEGYTQSSLATDYALARTGRYGAFGEGDLFSLLLQNSHMKMLQTVARKQPTIRMEGMGARRSRLIDVDDDSGVSEESSNTGAAE